MNQEHLAKLVTTILQAIEQATTLESLQEVEVRHMGRKSPFSELSRGLGVLSEDQRKEMGQAMAEARANITQALTARRVALSAKTWDSLDNTEWIDTTAPGTRPPEGHLHIVTQAIMEITDIFSRLGFRRVRYPEVEWDRYAFTDLNMPADHPARDEWETFFVDATESRTNGRMVLTPHTSSGQVREMERGKLPIRMINISKCYRRQIDVSHTPMFHQFEGLFIDHHVSVTHLKGVLDYFARMWFGPERRTRLRPYHFRFTEPSFEVDVSCGICGGTGMVGNLIKTKCRLCKEGWLELGGAGMVHPNVLRAGGIDSEKWGGFAFGWGVERTAMMRSGVQLPDIRELYKNDFRFLRQF